MAGVEDALRNRRVALWKYDSEQWSAIRKLSRNGVVGDRANSGLSSGVSSIDEKRHGLTYAGISQNPDAVEMASLGVQRQCATRYDADRKRA
jgi:hypothetical protein